MENKATNIYTLSKRSYYGKGPALEIMRTFEKYGEAWKAGKEYLEMHSRKKTMFLQAWEGPEPGQGFIKQYTLRQRPRTKKAIKAMRERTQAKRAAMTEKIKKEAGIIDDFDLPLEATEEGRETLAEIEETEKMLGIE